MKTPRDSKIIQPQQKRIGKESHECKNKNELNQSILNNSIEFMKKFPESEIVVAGGCDCFREVVSENGQIRIRMLVYKCRVVTIVGFSEIGDYYINISRVERLKIGNT